MSSPQVSICSSTCLLHVLSVITVGGGERGERAVRGYWRPAPAWSRPSFHLGIFAVAAIPQSARNSGGGGTRRSTLMSSAWTEAGSPLGCWPLGERVESGGCGEAGRFSHKWLCPWLTACPRGSVTQSVLTPMLLGSWAQNSHRRPCLSLESPESHATLLAPFRSSPSLVCSSGSLTLFSLPDSGLISFSSASPLETTLHSQPTSEQDTLLHPLTN